LIAARGLFLSTGLANPIFNKRDAAGAHFEAMRWPESKPVSAFCGTIDQASPVPWRRREALTGEDPKRGLARGGKLGVAVRRWPLAPMLLFTAALLSLCGAGHAADLALRTAPPATGGDLASVGIACSIGAPVWAPPVATAEDLPWASVWLGHFSGGRRFDDGNGQTFVDWRDEKVCFSSRQKCLAWIAGLRRAYRHPEGFWTCLLLR
jgi:hypothetical protein